MIGTVFALSPYSTPMAAIKMAAKAIRYLRSHLSEIKAAMKAPTGAPKYIIVTSSMTCRQGNRAMRAASEPTP